MITMTTNSFSGNLGGRAYNRFYEVNTHCPALEQQVGQALSEHLAGRSGRILDIGVGTGDTSFEALALCPEIDLVSVDVEEQMVEVARERFASLPRISVIHADALDFLRNQPDNSFDAVVSGFCLHNIPTDIRAMIVTEIGRVLVPGGLFANCDKVALNDEAAHLQTLTEQILMFDGFADDPDYRRKWLEHYLVDDQLRFRITESQWIALLSSSNFHSISFTHRTLMDCLLCATKS